MFELIVAWSVFTFLVGKGTEAVVHAVKGTDPPRTRRKLAEINAAGGGSTARAAKAEASTPAGKSPSGSEHAAASRPRVGRRAFLEYLADVWEDHWITQANKHADRFPEKAKRARRKATARAANRDALVDELSERLRGRWEARRAARERNREDHKPTDSATSGDPGAPEEAAPDTSVPSEGPSSDEPPAEDRMAPPEPAPDAEAAPKPEGDTDTADGTEEPTGPSGGEPADDPGGHSRHDRDVPGPVRGRVLSFPGSLQPPEAAGPPSGLTGSTPSTGEAMSTNDTTEVMGLGGTTRFTETLITSYTQSTQQLEVTIASMQQAEVGEKALQRFATVLNLSESIVAEATAALEECRRQQLVQDAVLSNPDTGNKAFVTKE